MSDQPPPSLFRRWVHVQEEDTDDTRVYRPFGAEIPPARGRRGLEFREDGTFVEYQLGPVDRPEGIEGRWDADADNRVRVDVPDPTRQAETLEIMSVEGDELRIKK